MNKLGKIIRWTARIWSLISLAFVLLFFIGYSLDPSELPPTNTDFIVMAFFPVGVLLFMLLGWKWERLGGIGCLSSLAGFYIALYIQKQVLAMGPYFLLVAMPGVLFLISSILQRDNKKVRKNNSL